MPNTNSPEITRQTTLSDKSLVLGVLLWILVPALAIALRGIRWDEHAEFAPVFLGTVDYPQYHPLALWIHYVKNLQIFASALVMKFNADPTVISGMRNLLFLWATCLPTYLTGFALSRRALVGHIAVILLLFDLHAPFSSNYPWYTWPHFFSTGHVGRGAAMLTLAFLLLNKPRTALLLLGFLPAIHLGQAPLIFALTGLYLAHAFYTQDRSIVSRRCLWLIPGIAVFAATWLLQPAPPIIPESSVYFSNADPMPIIRGYLEIDPHRAKPGTWIPYTNGNLMLMLMILVTIGAAIMQRKSDLDRQPYVLLALYVAGCAIVVFGAMTLHLVLGDRIPLLIIGAMPYRFANHVAFLFPVAVAAILLRTKDETSFAQSGAVVSSLVLLSISMHPLLRNVLPGDLYSRYILHNGLSVFFGIGAMLGIITHAQIGERKVLLIWCAATLAALLITGIYHQLAVGTLLTGAGSFVALNAFFNKRATMRWTQPLLVTCTLIALATILSQQYQMRVTMPTKPMYSSIQDYLDSDETQNHLVLSAHDQVGLQSRIQQPVLVDFPLKTNIPYHHYLAPTIEKMYKDLYGISFVSPTIAGSPDWIEIWQLRSTAEWHVLADSYAFNYILAPRTLSLPFEILFEDEYEVFYRIRPTETP